LRSLSSDIAKYFIRCIIITEARMNKLDGLVVKVRKAAMAALKDLEDKGVPNVVTEGNRTAEKQMEAFRRGASKCDGIPLAMGGHGRSPHQLGRALDVVPLENGNPIWPPASDPRWLQIAAAFEAQGFEWGGRWEDFLDLPHYQMMI
jgi:peptidoglycan L-alanyl-D-glutamate endopeptidase CwlK